MHSGSDAAPGAPTAPEGVSNQTIAIEPSSNVKESVGPHAAQPVAESHPSATSTSIILQWLTYAFWGWTVVALSWLTYLSVGFFVEPGGKDDAGSDLVAYSLAAVVVLLTISFVCDRFYSRKEPVRKQGIASIVMVIHAVIFALSGIAAVIVAAFAAVMLVIGDNSGWAVTTLITGLIIAIVYVATLVRTVHLVKLPRLNLMYGLFMIGISLVITIAGIVGPAVYAVQTRDDRLIENGLDDVSFAIRDFTKRTEQLPKTLSDIESTLSPDARQLVTRNMVEYVPGKQVSQGGTTAMPSITPTGNKQAYVRPVYTYQLCTTYKEAQSFDNNRFDDPGDTGAQTDPDTSSHAAGRVCYELVSSSLYDLLQN
jgi:hypothetical protein